MKAAGDAREVLMSFTCDPYQPIDDEFGLTRMAIKTFITYGIHFSILTKGGMRSEVDFDLLAAHPDLCRYGATLTLADYEDLIWEPNAATTYDRILTLRKAHNLGIQTWVSLEPVIYPDHTLKLINMTYKYIDEYKIGKFNHAREESLLEFFKKVNYDYPQTPEWEKFVADAKCLLDKLGNKYTFKKDLQEYIRK